MSTFAAGLASTVAGLLAGVRAAVTTAAGAVPLAPLALAGAAGVAAFALPLKLNILVAIAAAIAVGLLIEAVDRAFDHEILVVGPGIKTGMPILYENPREVGADRIVNAVAALMASR